MTCRDYLRPDRGDFGYTTYTSSGSTGPYTIGFDYPFKATVSTGSSTPYVRVYVDGTEASYTLTSSNSLTLTIAPDSGVLIEIIRDSKLNDTLIDWTNSSALTAENLQLENDQHQWLLQELWMHLKALGCLLDGLGADGGTANEYRFTGDGETVSFSLEPETDLTDPRVLVFINGVRQATDIYSVTESGGYSTVAFDEAPADGAKLSFVVFAGILVNYTVGDGTIGTSQLADGSVTYAKLDLDDHGSDNQAFMKRSGTWQADDILHTDVQDFDAGVQENRLDQLATPTSSVSFGNQRITNLAAPVDSTDAVRKGYVDSGITAIAPSRGNATLSAGTGNSYSIVNLGFQPVAVDIFANGDKTSLAYSATAHDLLLARFQNLVLSTEEVQNTVSINRSNGNDTTRVVRVELQSSGFKVTLDGSSITGAVSYTAYRQ